MIDNEHGNWFRIFPCLYYNTMQEITQEGTDLSVSLLAANLYSLVLILPLAAFIIVAVYLIHGLQILVDGFFYWHDRLLLGISILLVGIIVHEGLHGIAWLFVAKNGRYAIKFGFHLAAFSPYAHCTEPMPARSYRITVILPGMVLGVVPLAIGILLGNGPVIVFGFLFTLSAGGDALILWQVRKIPPGTLVRDHPDRAGCLVIRDTHEQDTSE